MEFLVVVCAAIAVGAMILSFLFLRLSQREAEKAVSFADDAKLFAEDAESERKRIRDFSGHVTAWVTAVGGAQERAKQIKEEVEQRVIGLEAWAKSLVEKLESERKGADDELRARQVDCDYSVMLAADKAKQTADIAEVVKLEVAKIETLIAKLNKDRAENPPFVAITYGEESGEPEKAEVSINEKEMVDDAVKYINEQRDEILKMLDEKKRRSDIFRGVAIGHLVVDKDGRVKSCGTQGVVHNVTLDPEPCGVTVTTLPAGQPFEFKPTQVHPVVTEGGE